jgi:hypothetical protein
MSKTKAIILMGFVLALGAGVAVGMLGSRALPQPSDRRARFIQELELTPQQEDQMKGIWMNLMQTKGREYAEAFRSIEQQRASAIQALLNEEQKQKSEAINQEFAKQGQELWKRAEQDFESATQKTRQILSPSQQEKFDALMTKFRSEHSRGHWGMGSGPTTAVQ